MANDSEAIKEHFERGVALLQRGYPEDALARLSQAYLLRPSSPPIQSWYALALALAKSEHQRSVELANLAVAEEFYNPGLHLNLARIHLSCGGKKEAVRALKGALVVDPDNPAVRRELTKLGSRRSPVLGCLQRDHAINRFLGRVRARLASPPAASRRPPRKPARH